MNAVYSEYFQKSKVFLYPVLEIKKGVRYVPMETYIAWEDVYSSEDNMFLCLYSAENDKDYKAFQEKYLLNHKLLKEYHKLDNDLFLFVFNFNKFKYDMEKFMTGKYSRFSINFKNKISKFFGEVGTIPTYIDSYINPEEYHDRYAESLKVSLDTIKDVHELCSKPDIDKETLKYKNEEIDLFKNNSIPLKKNKV
jgi:hypothetical protein